MMEQRVNIDAAWLLSTLVLIERFAREAAHALSITMREHGNASADKHINISIQMLRKVTEEFRNVLNGPVVVAPPPGLNGSGLRLKDDRVGP